MAPASSPASLNRRDFLTCAAGIAPALALIGCGSGPVAKTPPNIVYILADDLGYGDPACYNADSKLATPNIDRLAREGMRFTDAHAPSTVSTPTRYSILTGRYCWRSSLKYGELMGDSPALIESGRMTAASLLKSRGYRTACIGKWHLGLGTDEVTDYTKPLKPAPADYGFDYFFGIPASLDMEPYLYIENDRAVELPTDTIGESPMPAYYRGGAIAPGFRHVDVLPTLTEKACGHLADCAQTASDQPFFLYFALTAPHTPWVPVPEFEGKSGIGPYGDFVMQVDHTVGQVLDTLDTLGLTDNTLVIFTSDNGADERYIDPAKGHDPNGMLRGQKADSWEGGHRVPFIVRWPDRIAAGSVSDELVSLTDFLATCASMLEVSLPDDAAEDSFDMTPALFGDSTGEPVRPFSIQQSLSGWLSVREGDWKFIAHQGSGGFGYTAIDNLRLEGAKGQLYNLAEDPREENNLYDFDMLRVSHFIRRISEARFSGRTRPAQVRVESR